MVTNAADLPTVDLVGNRYQDASDASLLVRDYGSGTVSVGGATRHREGWANAATDLQRGGLWDDNSGAKDNDVYYLGKLQVGVTYTFWLLTENHDDTVSYDSPYDYQWPGISFSLGYFDASSGTFEPVDVPDSSWNGAGERMTFTPGNSLDNPATDEYYLKVYHFNSGEPKNTPYLIAAADLTNPGVMSFYQGIVDNMVVQKHQGGSGNDTLRGNELANTLRGFEGNDSIYGNGGDDALSGGTGDDLLDGGAGNDTAILSGSRSEYSTAYAAVNSTSTLVITDSVSGRDGADTIKGVEFFQFADGTLSLAQLLTPPTPPVTDPPETTITTSTSTILSDGVLDVVAIGAANLTLTGNSLNNSLKGNVGKNTLKGLAGNDQLWGGYGNDVLYGSGGKDAFVFNTKLGTSKTDRKVNFDKIADFSVRDDSLWLDNGIFKKLGSGTLTNPKLLKKAYFAIDNAKDDNDYVIYNKKTGVLSYDVDGSGSKAAVEFAQLKKGLALKYTDLFVI